MNTVRSFSGLLFEEYEQGFLKKKTHIKELDVPSEIKRRNEILLVNMFILISRFIDIFLKSKGVDEKEIMFFKIKSRKLMTESDISIKPEDILDCETGNDFDKFKYKLIRKQSLLERSKLLTAISLNPNLFDL